MTGGHAQAAAPAPSQRSQHERRPVVVVCGLALQWIAIALAVVALAIPLIRLLALAVMDGIPLPGALGVVTLIAVLPGALVAVQSIVLVFAAKGRNWARILLGVLAVLAAIGAVSSVTADLPLHPGSVLSIIGVVLLFLPAANAWYRSRRTPSVPRTVPAPQR
ncbi:hypothetical protein [Agrococcus citreus]|uniref:hypothetical protein n=1 Tax=Agrococcus citreus TaxID=84643 RepID=UPI0031D925E4